VLSVGGNGRSYVLILEAGPSADTTQSKLYFARISTKVGFCRVSISDTFLLVLCRSRFQFLLLTASFLCKWQVRVPFSAFRPVKPDDLPLDPFLVHTMTIRFEPRRQVCLSVNCHKNTMRFQHSFAFNGCEMIGFFYLPWVFISQFLFEFGLIDWDEMPLIVKIAPNWVKYS
jgi:hypothetical protein